MPPNEILPSAFTTADSPFSFRVASSFTAATNLSTLESTTLPEPSVEAIARIPISLSNELALTASAKFVAPVFSVVLPDALTLTPSISIVRRPLVLSIVSSCDAVPLPTVILVGDEAAPALFKKVGEAETVTPANVADKFPVVGFI